MTFDSTLKHLPNILYQFKCLFNFKIYIFYYKYTQTKRNAPLDFLVKLSFKYENVSCHKILISEKILLKLECGVDKYLYLLFVRIIHTRRKLNKFWKRYSMPQSTRNSQYALQLQCMKTVCCKPIFIS